jgi:hypothetical protein
MSAELTEEQVKTIRELLRECETFDSLNNFEQGFIDQLRDRFTQYGNLTYLSDKQWAVIRRIQEKVNG